MISSIAAVIFTALALAYQYGCHSLFARRASLGDDEENFVSKRDKLGKLQFTKCEKQVRHYRCFADIADQSDSKVVKTGRFLPFSASGQFGAEHVDFILENTKEKCIGAFPSEVWFLDLRAERHLFINGKPAVWKTKCEEIGETAEDILEDENQRIAQIGKTVIIKEHKGNDVSLEVKSIQSEQELVESKSFHYIRFPIVEHARPTDECVNDLVQFFLDHPKAWMHAHCYVTQRSTLVLTMADMLHHAHLISFDDILYRAKAIGGSNLTKIPDANSDKYSLVLARNQFLQDFYLYCRQENPMQNPKAKTWLEWLPVQIKDEV